MFKVPLLPRLDCVVLMPHRVFLPERRPLLGDTALRTSKYRLQCAMPYRIFDTMQLASCSFACPEQKVELTKYSWPPSVKELMIYHNNAQCTSFSFVFMFSIDTTEFIGKGRNRQNRSKMQTG